MYTTVICSPANEEASSKYDPNTSQNDFLYSSMAYDLHHVQWYKITYMNYNVVYHSSRSELYLKFNDDEQKSAITLHGTCIPYDFADWLPEKAEVDVQHANQVPKRDLLWWILSTGGRLKFVCTVI